MPVAPTGFFGRLPNEILLDIVGILPIKDVLALDTSTHHLLRVLRKRTDHCEYFRTQGPFTDATDLLEVMSTHGAVLSGSRALEWFIPGSTSAISDWDFYVSPELDAVTALKRSLERSGVQFETCLTQAARKLQHESFVFLNCKQIVSIAYESHIASDTPLLEQEIIEMVHRTFPELQNISSYVQKDGSVSWIPDLRPITIGRDGSITTEPSVALDESFDDYETIASALLCGTIQKRGRTIPIQVIVGAFDPREQITTEPSLSFDSVLRSIFRFYGSHVQCFLTKHAAVHMYYRLAAEKRSYRWQVPEVIRKRADAAVQKFQARGFRFSTALGNDDCWTFRTVLDDDSFFVGVDTPMKHSPSLTLIKDLEWMHQRDMIRPYGGPLMREARRELLSFGMIRWE